MIRWTGVAPWQVEFLFKGMLLSLPLLPTRYAAEVASDPMQVLCVGPAPPRTCSV